MANSKLLDKCKLNLRQAAPKTISDEAIAAFVDKIGALKEAELRKGNGNFRKAVAEFLDEHRVALAKQRQEKIQNVLKNKRFAEFASQFNEGTGKRRGMQMVEAMMAEMGGGQQMKKAINDSVDRNALTMHADYSDAVSLPMKREGVWDIFTKGVLEREIMMELHEMKAGGSPGISKSAEALKIAEIISAMHKRQLADMRAAGVDIGSIDNYIMRQSHDRKTVRVAGFEQWKSDIAGLIDPQKTFGLDAGDPVKMNEYLEVAYEHITSGKFELPDDLIQASDELITTANYAKLGDKISKSRQIFFKDGASFYEYNKKYGVNDLPTALHRQMKTSSRNAALIQKFGTNPDAAFEARKVRVRQMLKNDDEALAAFKAGTDGIDNLYKNISGKTSIAVDETLATVSSITRAMTNMSSLGGTVLRSFPDLANGMAITSSATGNGLFESAGKFVRAFLDSVRPSEAREVSALIGGYVRDHLSEVAQVTGADAIDRVPGLVARTSNNFFKYTGLNYWTETTRHAPQLLLAREGAIHSGVNWRDLPAQYRANLERYNIGGDDWSRISKTAGDLGDGTRGILAERIEDRKTQLKWKNYIQEIADFSAPNPNARVRSRINRGTAPGTIAGEATRFIGQFKAFPLFSYDIGLRLLASNPEKPIQFYRDVLRGKGDWHRMAGFMIGGSTMAYIGDSFLSISKNETPLDPTDPWTWKRSLQLSGAAGMYGDILLGEAQRLQNGGFLSTLAGPVPSKAAEVASISAAFAQHSTKALAEGESVADATTKDQLKAFNFLVRQAPGNNVFYLKTAMDQALLDRIREAIDPNFVEDKRARLEKYNKTELIDF